MLTGALLGGTVLRSFTHSAPLWLAAGLLTGRAAGVCGMTRRPTADTWR
jgi:hypothetical protein